MKTFTPSFPYSTVMELFIPQYTTAKGVTQKSYPENGIVICCSFRTFGGTETTENGLYSVTDTATIETWFRPDIKSDCLLKDADGKTYEIIGIPENINRRNQFLKFKVKSVRGGA